MPAISSETVTRVSVVAASLVETIATVTASLAAVTGPTNDEAERAVFVAELFRRMGYSDVATDSLSDVIGRIPG